MLVSNISLLVMDVEVLLSSPSDSPSGVVAATVPPCEHPFNPITETALTAATVPAAAAVDKKERREKVPLVSSILPPELIVILRI